MKSLINIAVWTLTRDGRPPAKGPFRGFSEEVALVC